MKDEPADFQRPILARIRGPSLTTRAQAFPAVCEVLTSVGGAQLDLKITGEERQRQMRVMLKDVDVLRVAVALIETAPADLINSVGTELGKLKLLNQLAAIGRVAQATLADHELRVPQATQAHNARVARGQED